MSIPWGFPPKIDTMFNLSFSQKFLSFLCRKPLEVYYSQDTGEEAFSEDLL